MNKKITVTIVMSSLVALFLSVMGVGADAYGADAITDLFSGLWNAFWPLVALLFIIFMILTYFKGPGWLTKIFGMGRR